MRQRKERNQPRGWGNRFVGPRVNCENLPCLPVAAVALVLEDPRHLAYLMVWKDDRSGEVIVAARVTAYTDPEIRWAKCVEIKRADGTLNRILTIERPMPRNGGKARLVICPRCQTARRALYPWKLNPAKQHAVFRAPTWQCRSCARLRYASEGGALVLHSYTELGRQMEALEGLSRSPRPEPWYPYVFANPTDAERILRA